MTLNEYRENVLHIIDTYVVDDPTKDLSLHNCIMLQYAVMCVQEVISKKKKESEKILRMV